jgi:2-polyprenyl-6-methoxyphenol hydroxylase-like FAD-dependent oxidoreductase
MADDLDVLIVGAGPTGLTLALALARHDVRVRIVDREPGPPPESRALGVQARTLEVLDDAGVAMEMVARGRRAPGIRIHFGGTPVEVRFDGLDTAWPFVLVLPQSETERLLAARAAAVGVAVERRTELTALDADAGGVTAGLRHGDGREEAVRSRWIAGCDGAASTVRRLAGTRFTGTRYEETFWLADVRVHGLPPGDGLQAFLGDAGALFAAPFADGRHRLVVLSTEVPSSAAPPRLDDVQRLAARIGPPALTLDDPGWLSSFQIHRRIAAPGFRRGRVLLAGDAAHVHSPAGGQGMNTGIQDAWNLGWKLGLVARGQAHEPLLDSYDAERRPVALAVLRGTDALMRAALLRNRLLRTLRDRVAPRVIARPAVQERIRLTVSELAVAYPESPIVGGTAGFAAGPRPGERLPDGVLEAAGGRPARLLEAVRGPRLSVLCFAGTRLPVPPPPVDARHAAVVAVHVVTAGEHRPGAWRDPDGALHRRFGADAPCTYVVRPDGHVGFRGRGWDAGALGAHLRRVLG